MKLFLLLVFISVGCLVNAQEVSVNGAMYEVKKGQIFKGGLDVTETLSTEEQLQIREAFDREIARIKAAEREEKRLKNAEKDQKRAEKKQKKAEKALKQKEKAESNFNKAEKKYEDAIKKYEKLKKKGKLSPEDEKKWLDKIEKYNKATIKAKRKL
ncbi:hypothetical protein L3X39_04430 [Sabulilitoribacter multivorans]|uniref:Uncharacterized protein n=1 Tax=Flaviramulus multivorans TaxID=1304750 RepID=A0ABS9IGX5_9FLAO|nr:hypothetical protein [Flaviramulus multivorans]MCF7559875.1 hypothetical protein [Flaviramulus multivorans]